MKSERRRVEWWLFATAFIAFAYFHQGGGWNANSRFAMVRAMVEQRTLAIDSYLIYTPVSDSSRDLRRIPLHDASYEADGETKVLAWIDRESRATPVNGTVINSDDTKKVTLVDLRSVAASGDVSYYRGHFYPNKAPGTSFLALPAYWFIYQIERLTDANPDSWWTLTMNAGLSSAFSVGILSALGVVLFYRLAISFSGGRTTASLLAALTFAFGTMFFPYATSMYEHDIIGACLLASFYFLYRAKTGSGSPHAFVFLGGVCAGYAAITNYIVAIVVILLGLYAILSVRGKRAWFWFGLGVLGPLLLICAYNLACFDTAFTTNYRYQNPYFRSTSTAFLDVFVMPRWNVPGAILFSPFRGLFFTSPVLLMAVAGLVLLYRNREFRAEILLVAATVAFFVLVNISFEAWEGGWGVTPRYLGPAIPFLALGLAIGYTRFFKITCALGIISTLIMLLITAVDPQPPIGVSDTARILDKPVWRYNPITEYELPVFLRERPWPLIRQMEDRVMDYYEAQLSKGNLSEAERHAELVRFRNHIDVLIAAHQPAPLALKREAGEPDPGRDIQLSDVTTIAGPVSVNIGGIYGGGLLGEQELRWNSFNAGEFLFPASRWSLAPLLAATGLLAGLALRSTHRLDNPSA